MDEYSLVLDEFEPLKCAELSAFFILHIALIQSFYQIAENIKRQIKNGMEEIGEKEAKT